MVNTYKVKVMINEKTFEGEYNLKKLLEELERVIKWKKEKGRE